MVAQTRRDVDTSAAEFSSGDVETDRVLESLRGKGYRIGAVQVVFGVGDVRGRILYVVNGTPLDRAQLRGLDRGWLKLPEPRPGSGPGPRPPLPEP